MNLIWTPKTGDYLVITKPIEYVTWANSGIITWQVSWTSQQKFKIASHWNRLSLKLIPGQWFEIANGYWPKKSSGFTLKYPLLMLKLERSARDRKWCKEWIAQKIREDALTKFTDKEKEVIEKVDFTCTTRNLDFSAGDLNGKCEIVDSRNAAKAISSKILNAPLEQAPTRWQRLET